jgi:hypothetical protein
MKYLSAHIIPINITMQKIRILDDADFDLVKNKMALDGDLEKSFKNYFLDNTEKKFYCYGKWEGDTFSCVAVIENEEIPAWTYSRYNSTSIDEELLIYATTQLELKNIKQIFTLTDISEIDRLARIFNRYNRYTEHLVEENCLTGYENIDHDVLQYKTYNKQMIVSLWVLKNEYRTI